MSSSIPSSRSQNWRWWVCGLLLLATMINYMDRLTLNLLAKHIIDALSLDKRDYATIESGFALAFAGGAIICGFLVDRWNVFWVYPFAVLAWSAAGFCTGFATGFWSLLICRVCLGFAEAANWPCALRTTQRILPPGERSMGNSILQSGAAFGAVLIPLVMFWLFDETRIETWSRPFFVVGAIGAMWVFGWWATVRPADLSLQTASSHESVKAAGPGLPPGLLARRFAVLVVLVVTINMTWHFLRAWGPLFLQEKYALSQGQTNSFSLAYYVCTDLGVLSAGVVTLWLVRRRIPVHASRRLAFLGYALLTVLCFLVPFLPTPDPTQDPTFPLATWAPAWISWMVPTYEALLVMVLLLVVGFGALGVFPNYYSFSQDLTTRHQGKLTGTLGCCCWLAMAIWQKGIGEIVHHTQSYTIPFLISGLAPLFGFVVLLVFWGPVEDGGSPSKPGASEPVAADERITPAGAIQPTPGGS